MSYKRLTLVDREEISKGIWSGEQFSTIALRINKHPSTVCNEVYQNISFKKRSYQAVLAHRKSLEKRTQGRKKKIDICLQLKQYIYEKLSMEGSPEEIARRIKM